MPSDNLLTLARGSVLYLGSAVPLETSVGLEALQMPLRDRYLTTDQGQKVSGIDAVLTVYSSGLLMQYPGDDSSSTWFPMQTLHMCAAVRAVYTQGSTRFVSIDSPQAQATREPPIFAVIMRRSRGVKVLECHVFVCKSTDAALAFVQSCTHAFQHQEGWLSGMPGADQFQLGGGMSRIVAADSMSGMADMPRTPLQGFMYSADQPTHMYNITGSDPPSAPVPVQAPAPAPAPVPPAPAPVPQMAAPMQYIAMNPPGAPVPQYPQMTIPQGYFADWDQNYGMSYMIIPDSPFYPGDAAYNKQKKKKPKKKKKKAKKTKKVEEEEEEEEEEELYYVRRSKLDQGQVPPDFVPVQQGEERYVIQRQGPDPQWAPDMRYSAEPIRNDGGTDIHYIPLPKAPQTQDQLIQPTTADIVHFARVPNDQAAAPFDPYSFRAQPSGVEYDYKREYDAARQQAIYGSGPQQGVYDRKLPRTSYQYDERGFGGMADRLGYLP